MKKRGGEAGVTLLEMTVTLACFFLVLTTAVQVYLAGMRLWGQGSQQALDQTGARWVADALSAFIRASRGMDPTTRASEDDGVLWLQLQDGRLARVDLDRDRQAVRVAIGGGSPAGFTPEETRWIGEHVSDVHFASKGPEIVVRVAVEGGDATGAVEVAATPRVDSGSPADLRGW